MKSALILFFMFVILSVAVCLIVTQPTMAVEQHPLTFPDIRGALEAHVRKMSEEFPPRSDDTDKLDVTAAYIRSEFGRTGGKLRDQEYTVWGIPYRNVSLLLGPGTGKRIVVGAHYDTADGLPGADDNASGVAALIELAKLLDKAPLSKSIELVAYTLEEPPYFRTQHMGSAVHARALREAGVEVTLMIALETIGYFDDTAGSQEYPLPFLDKIYPDKGNFIAVVGRLGEIKQVRQVKKTMMSVSSLPVYTINAPAAIPGIDFSDHMNYWREGFPAIMITDTALYRNPNYHTANDLPDTLDYTRMAEVVKGVYGVLSVMAGN